MTRTSGDPSLLRRMNAAAALRELMQADRPLTVAELARRVGITRPPTESIVADLVAGSWAQEQLPEPEDVRSAGRPARRYRFRADAGRVLGIDIGAHKTLAVVTDLRGTVLAERRTSLSPEEGATGRLAAVRRNAVRCLSAAGSSRQRLTAAGIGTTGVVDDEGRVALSHVLPEWTGLDLRSAVGRWLSCPVLVENDMRLGALGERWRGAARDADDVVLLHAGRRLSTGLLLDGRPRRGSHGAAGEIGHLAYLNWLHSFERFAPYDDPAAGEERPAEAAQRVFEAARHGDRAAAELVDAFARELAAGLAAMVLAIDPDIVVIGGGLSRTGELLAGPVRGYLSDHCLFPPRVATSELGDEAVALGAVRHALDHVERSLLAGDLPALPSVHPG
ncbi:ROK family protein [Streptomyces sp. NBC_01387]|uniref:ROK family protein n=1 Tax=Streptomyces sp. NBC_01387 TaxID=2903849 RepID=UPI00324346EB